MKNFKLPLIVLLCAGLLTLAFYGCKKDAQSPTLTSNAKPVAVPANCTGYTVTLERTTTGTTTIFTWTITNPNPGNGSGTTIQNLSHWDFIPGECLDNNWQDVLSASFRYGTTGDFQPITISGVFIDDIKPDPSLVKGGCYGDDVFKFDQGTSGSTPTQYRIELLGNWGTGKLEVYYKSGTNTGCCYNSYDNIGIGCPESEDVCSFSQGYWFANNSAHPDGVHPWYVDPNNESLGLKTITIGGKEYTNAEGLAIWNASNKGGITDSKKAFTQLAAIRLSGVDESDPAISAAIATIECWLSDISKLSGSTPIYLPNQTNASIATCGNARTAAGTISAWIKANHCVSD